MEESSKRQSSLSVSIAIVIAGAMIAAALYFSGKAPESKDIDQPSEQPSVSSASVRDLSADEHFLGNPSAPISMIVYTDFECSFCKRFHGTLKEVADSYGKNGTVNWIYRNFPLYQIHDRAAKEAEATECVAEIEGNSAYWEYVDLIFSTTQSNNTLDPKELPLLAVKAGVSEEKFNECLSSGKYSEKVSNEYQEAANAGGSGTPFTVFIAKKDISSKTEETILGLIPTFNLPPDTLSISGDKKQLRMSGALPFSVIQKILDALLAN